MQKILEHKKLLAAALFFAFLTFLAASVYISDVQNDYALKTQLKISEQETKLAAIAELTGRDGADAVVEEIIKDCSIENRERFDTLLSSLAELNAQELIEVEQLFNSCGNFYAERKAVMVARLEREYEVYLDFIDILSLIDEEASKVTYNIEGWGNLVAQEKKRSELSTSLVSIQGQIIDSLRKKTPLSSDEMQLLLVEGKETKDALIKISTEIDDLREKVLDI
jgi:predicted type IV restriction endonuclease